MDWIDAVLEANYRISNQAGPRRQQLVVPPEAEFPLIAISSEFTERSNASHTSIISAKTVRTIAVSPAKLSSSLGSLIEIHEERNARFTFGHAVFPYCAKDLRQGFPTGNAYPFSRGSGEAYDHRSERGVRGKLQRNMRYILEQLGYGDPGITASTVETPELALIQAVSPSDV